MFLAFTLVAGKGDTIHASEGSILSEILTNTYNIYDNSGTLNAKIATLNNPTTLTTIDDTTLLATATLNDAIEQAFKSKDKETQIYNVKEGDTLSFIASRFGISTSTILQSNKIKNADTIKLGDELIILPIDGVLHTVTNGDTVLALANNYSADAVDIIEYNNLGESGDLFIGEELIIPGGRVPVIRSSSVRKATSIRSLPQNDGYFMVPVSGVITQHAHGYRGNAVDIGADYGTPIYSAAGGTISRADTTGWNGGYGLVVEISHPNGSTSLYAHMSTVFVDKGQSVTKGEKIGAIGNTGRSTGNHLHFEVTPKSMHPLL